jgi:predicted nuclease of restriction endonuclease-like RecB superfamily
VKKTRNKFEASIERQLKRAKVRFSYETEKIPYVLGGHYIPDFIISTPNGRIYIECKGYFRPEHKRKMLAVKRQHPNLDIRIVFYSGTRSNIRWAERHDFKYATEKIPTEWIKGL